MHKNSLLLMSNFLNKYLKNESLNILDVGSFVVKGQQKFGSYKQFMKSSWKYLGIDIAPGRNVDLIVEQYKWNIGIFDVIITGQTLEHVEYPWLFMEEINNHLKSNGLCCIIAPAVIHEHKYPVDCYRYYPDGMKALASWVKFKVLECYRTIDEKDHLEDTCLIAIKP